VAPRSNPIYNWALTAVAYDEVWAASEPADGRAFADAARTPEDAQLMERLLQRERGVVRAQVRSGVSGPALWERSVRGRKHWLAVPDLAALAAARDVTAVGFFGQTRPDVDHAILFELEREVAATFVNYSRYGLLSYYDAELAGRAVRYGNLILFSTAQVPREWYENPAHEQSVAIAREHYRSIRLHNARIHGPFLGSGGITVERTKYLDFEREPVWRGLRLYTDGDVGAALAGERG
jgi:hypothetical protein